MSVSREEIFGPVLSILPYKTEEEAIEMANDTVYGLAAYVSSRDIAHARKVAAQLRAGTVNIHYPDINTFELGQHGRYRTNVWQYRRVNTPKAGRMDELALHPTVKPIAMIADAIKDVSSRNGIVLDLFGGSGSTLIAAHKTGRRAYLCELDPVYRGRIVQRWQVYAKDVP